MSKEALTLLRGAGYNIKQKLGKQKFISVFRTTNSSARTRRKREHLITKLLAECYADEEITKRLKRHEDLTRLALQVQHILHHPEYREMKDKGTLRRTIAQLLLDKDHREYVEKVLKENKKRQWPEFRPLCTAKKIKSPETVVKTIFTNLDKAWNYERGRYSKNKAGIKFQKAVRDLMSKDWITNYCLLAGYVPVMKARKLGHMGSLIAETCGCRKFDKYAVRKSFLKKIYKESHNYTYHTMKRSLQRIENRIVVKRSQQTPKATLYMKSPKPGVWTRVFKGTSARVAKGASLTLSPSSLGITASTSNLNVLSEKALASYNVKELSSPNLNPKDVYDVAIKCFGVTPNLPLKLLPARILTLMELTTVLDHPNIIRFIESFATNKEIFIVMPYAVNRSLHHIINNYGQLMLKTAKVWTFHIAMAVQYLHAAGIIHRNIKCSNILITINYDAVLSGFGSAKIKWLDLLHLQNISSSNYHVGYRPYRPPEVLRRRPYSLPPIDVWSLGVVLFRMLNNCFPYCYHNKKLMCKQQHTRQWKKNWRRDTPVGKLCWKLMKRMLEPNPAKRIKIDGVVNHGWFAELPIPKAHKKSVRQAAYLFLPQEPHDDTEDHQQITKQLSHKDVNLDELCSLLEKTLSDERQFQPLESHPVYNECYTKHKLQRGTLIKNIDVALRKKIPKIKRPQKPLEYEPYLSDMEASEIQERTDAGIQELRKRPEQARKFLQAVEVDETNKISLAEIVKVVKERTEELIVKEDEMSKKIYLFTPRREGSEPRSILTKLKKGISARNSQSTATVFSVGPTRDVIPLSTLHTTTTPEQLILQDNSSYPKLEFAKVLSSSDSRLEEGEGEEGGKWIQEEYAEESEVEEQVASAIAYEDYVDEYTVEYDEESEQ